MDSARFLKQERNRQEQIRQLQISTPVPQVVHQSGYNDRYYDQSPISPQQYHKGPYSHGVYSEQHSYHASSSLASPPISNPRSSHPATFEPPFQSPSQQQVLEQTYTFPNLTPINTNLSQFNKKKGPVSATSNLIKDAFKSLISPRPDTAPVSSMGSDGGRTKASLSHEEHDPIFDLPPLQVVRSVCTYQAQFRNEVSFSKGEFFFVVEERADGYYRITNPALKLKGVAPSSCFEPLGRQQSSPENGSVPSVQSSFRASSSPRNVTNNQSHDDPFGASQKSTYQNDMPSHMPMPSIPILRNEEAPPTLPSLPRLDSYSHYSFLGSIPVGNGLSSLESLEETFDQYFTLNENQQNESGDEIESRVNSDADTIKSLKLPPFESLPRIILPAYSKHEEAIPTQSEDEDDEDEDHRMTIHHSNCLTSDKPLPVSPSIVSFAEYHSQFRGPLSPNHSSSSTSSFSSLNKGAGERFASCLPKTDGLPTPTSSSSFAYSDNVRDRSISSASSTSTNSHEKYSKHALDSSNNNTSPLYYPSPEREVPVLSAPPLPRLEIQVTSPSFVGPSNTPKSPSSLHNPLYKSISVVKYEPAGAQGPWIFTLDLVTNSEWHRVLFRTYEDLWALHVALLTHFPKEGGQVSGYERRIPFLESPVSISQLIEDESWTDLSGRVPRTLTKHGVVIPHTANAKLKEQARTMELYLGLLNQHGSHLLTSKAASRFFDLREGDLHSPMPHVFDTSDTLLDLLSEFQTMDRPHFSEQHSSSQLDSSRSSKRGSEDAKIQLDYGGRRASIPADSLFPTTDSYTHFITCSSSAGSYDVPEGLFRQLKEMASLVFSLGSVQYLMIKDETKQLVPIVGDFDLWLVLRTYPGETVLYVT